MLLRIILSAIVFGISFSVLFEDAYSKEISNDDTKQTFRGILLKPGDLNLIKLSDGEPEDKSPSWSPDDSRIVFERNGDIYIANSDGTELRRLESGNNCDPQWSPDGTKIIFVYSCMKKSQIYMINDEGLEKTKISTSLDYEASDPSWSPDGTKIVFLSSEEAQTKSIYTMKIDGSERTQISYDGLQYLRPDWSPDGTKIISTVFNVQKEGMQPDIVMMNVDGSDRKILTSTNENSFFPKWSPDGKKIIFLDKIDGKYLVSKMDPNGFNQITLSQIEKRYPYADWSPDGTKIIFSDDRDEYWSLYTMNSDGSNQKKLPAYSKNFTYPDLPENPFSSPRKLLKLGFFPEEVKCNSGLTLISKINLMPACVKMETKQKLIENGWGIDLFSIDSFEDCEAAGNPVTKSYPRQCTTLDNRQFAEEIKPRQNTDDGINSVLRQNNFDCFTFWKATITSDIDNKTLEVLIRNEIAKFGPVYDLSERDITIENMDSNRVEITIQGCWGWTETNEPDLKMAIENLSVVKEIN